MEEDCQSAISNPPSAITLQPHLTLLTPSPKLPAPLGWSIVMAFKCIIVTPEQQALDESATQAIVPAWDGQVGILTDRAPSW